MKMKSIKQLALAASILFAASASNAQIQNVLLAVFENPANSIPANVNISLLSGFVPVLPVAYIEPLTLPSYVTNGGILLSPGLPVPPLPLVNQPLAVLGIGGLDLVGIGLPTDMIGPSFLASQILGILPMGLDALPGL
jgi:hypothetical protein